MLSTNARASSVPRCLIKTCMGQPSPVRSTTPFRKTVKSVWLKQRKRIGRIAVNTYQGLVPRIYSRSMQGVTRNDMDVFRQMFLKRRSFGSLDARLPCHDRAHFRGCHPVDFPTSHREYGGVRIKDHVSLKEIKGTRTGNGKAMILTWSVLCSDPIDVLGLDGVHYEIRRS